MAGPIIGDPYPIGTLPCPVDGCGEDIVIHARLSLEKRGGEVAIEAIADPTEFQFHLYGHGATIRMATDGDDSVIEAQMGEDE